MERNRRKRSPVSPSSLMPYRTPDYTCLPLLRFGEGGRGDEVKPKHLDNMHLRPLPIPSLRSGSNFRSERTTALILSANDGRIRF